ncbi:hypothetical protein ET464_08330 [Paenibacillus protaetiae]|uniref:Uncharacterized protein n=1 Tax=Paenibacillus protaetiae TaxID=2509456 RepID=A0A4P6F2P4_9BACL|nr:hypothetical protein [Paenibacillus protaetiae]QAY68419.1 hypothetical protein ET464_08330 [Paenibacillus protaetiae]
MNDHFKRDDRLGLLLPAVDGLWHELEPDEQAAIVARWEWIRGSIPDLVKQLETVINRKQDQLNQEDNFEVSCRLNTEIAEYASRINDLLIWYRADQEVDSRPHR